MLKIKRLFRRAVSLKKDTALAERKARLENILGASAKNWTQGREFDQNKVTVNDVRG